MDSEEHIILGQEISLQQLWNGIEDVSRFTLTSDQEQIVMRCRQSLDGLNKDETPVYGVSTGFGHLENTWIPPEKQGELQINLIRSHAIGSGEVVPYKVTKMAMILLIHSLAKGHSGIRLSTLNRLLMMLHQDIIPVSYTIGSLGASGDLAPLAHLALPLLGEGEIWVDGEPVATEKVLANYNLEALQLEAKEGLALINGTHFITAYSVLFLKRVRSVFFHSLVASSMSIEALRATDTPFASEIANLRKHPGHLTVASLLSKILEGSHIISSHKDPLVDHKTQDAYAFRCIPQVVGAIWDAFSYLERTVKVEINSVTDNPLVFPQENKILSGGNFHAEPLGFPLETSCMALVELANITEARISRLVSPFTPELPAFLASKPGVESGYMIAHYTTAAIVNKLRGLAHPNIVDNIPVSGNQEDHVSMVMTTAVRAWQMLELVEEVISFELMLANRGLNLVEHPTSSDPLEEIITLINQTIPFQKPDHVIRTQLLQYIDLLRSNQITMILDKYVELPDQFN